jgi:hypothetical protein
MDHNNTATIEDTIIYGVPSDDGEVMPLDPDSELTEIRGVNRTWWDTWHYEIAQTVRRVIIIACVWFSILSLLWFAHRWWK